MRRTGFLCGSANDVEPETSTELTSRQDLRQLHGNDSSLPERSLTSKPLRHAKPSDGSVVSHCQLSKTDHCCNPYSSCQCPDFGMWFPQQPLASFDASSSQRGAWSWKYACDNRRQSQMKTAPDSLQLAQRGKVSIVVTSRLGTM